MDGEFWEKEFTVFREGLSCVAEIHIDPELGDPSGYFDGQVRSNIIRILRALGTDRAREILKVDLFWTHCEDVVVSAAEKVMVKGEIDFEITEHQKKLMFEIAFPLESLQVLPQAQIPPHSWFKEFLRWMKSLSFS